MGKQLPGRGGCAPFIAILMALLGAAATNWVWLVLALDIPFFAMHAGSGLGPVQGRAL